MSNIRDNRGITLLELIVTIAIGSVVTLAAVTVLLLGLRIYKQSTDTAARQNEVRIGLTVMENLVAEGPITEVGGGTVLTTDGAELLRYDEDNGAILTGAGARILENVTGFTVTLDNNLVTFMVKIGEDQPYECSVFCRVVETEEDESEAPSTEGGALAVSACEELTTEAVLSAALGDEGVSPNVRAFLKTLAAQEGSTGRILTAEGEGEYYSQWYIGSYEDHPGWSKDTPWCACFVSWALDACSGYLEGETPRFANVDSFWAEFVTSDQWKTAQPEPGDVVFFDWIEDTEHNPQHVGVVLAESGGWIYTIEGNSNGKVAICKYTPDDACILGYGVLNWT